ncbi:MAG: DUF190 domain-containing protein [Solirubrobacteraceae bacterium]
MSAECLKLTMYFGERDRTEHRLLADELLDLYGRERIEVSVLLRGIEGFGLKHHLHTDALLSLSEDLPVVSVAVDTRERIEAILPQVLELKREGLLTLERAILHSSPIDASPLPEGEATKLTIYLGRRERTGRAPSFVAVCELLHSAGLSGATVLLGVDGTRHGQRQRARFFAHNSEVPLMIIAVGPEAQLAPVVPRLGELVQRPIVTLERVRICKRDGELLATPHELPGTDEHGLALWQKLMVYSSESARHNGQPLHRALIKALRQQSYTAGATSLRGIWGFHGDHPPHGDKLLQLRRHVPVVTVIVDTPERIARAFELVDEATAQGGLVTSEVVPAAHA